MAKGKCVKKLGKTGLKLLFLGDFLGDFGGADGGGRTHTTLRLPDFESSASANSATSAHQCRRGALGKAPRDGFKTYKTASRLQAHSLRFLRFRGTANSHDWPQRGPRNSWESKAGLAWCGGNVCPSVKVNAFLAGKQNGGRFKEERICMKFLIGISVLTGLCLAGCSSHPGSQGGGAEVETASARSSAQPAASRARQWPLMDPAPEAKPQGPARNVFPGMDRPEEDGPDFFMPKRYESLHI